MNAATTAINVTTAKNKAHSENCLITTTKTNNHAVDKLIIGGIFSLGYELLIGHSLQFLKIQKQTFGLPYGQIFKQATSRKGLLGLLDGFWPWGAMIAVGKGGVFSWGHAMGLSIFGGRFDRKTVDVLSGGLGGFVQGAVANPLLLLTTRVITDRSFSKNASFWESASHSQKVLVTIVRNEGISVLMKGSTFLTCKRVLDWTSRFYFVNCIEQYLYKQRLIAISATQTHVFSSMAGGVLSCIVTIPLDVIVATTQQHSASPTGNNANPIVVTSIIPTSFIEIMKFATRGLVARSIHAALATFLMKSLTYASFSHSPLKKDT